MPDLRLPELIILYVDGNPIAALPALTGTPALEQLSLRNTKITTLEGLHQLSKLEALHLGRGIKSIARAMHDHLLAREGLKLWAPRYTPYRDFAAKRTIV